MKWVVYGFIIVLVAFNWNPVDLPWWGWYLLIGLSNYLWFAAENRLWRFNDAGAFVEWAFFVFAWPVQLAFWVLTQVNAASGWLLERIWR